MEPKGQIITFYSYKGGTGRSMTLANVAWILASNGKKVLTIDWDLEAPGLHRYFAPFLVDKELKVSEGLMNMIDEFRLATITPKENSNDNWHESYTDVNGYAIPLDWDFDGGRLDFLPAGKQDAAYSGMVNLFHWDDFYTRHSGGAFFEAMKKKIRKAYDYILIDSRTGVSDTSGICTVQMPDAVVICFTLNNQSIKGAAGVANSIYEQWEGKGKGKDIDIFPVPMRVEPFEKTKLDLRRAYAKQMFHLFPAHLPAHSRAQFQEDVQVIYLPYYSYEEILATFGNKPGERISLLAPAEKLTESLTEFLTREPIRQLKVSERLESRRQLILDQFEGGQVETDPTRSLIRLANAVWGNLDLREQTRARRALLRLIRVADANEKNGDTLLRVKLSNFDSPSQAVLRKLDKTPLVAIEQIEETEKKDQGEQEGVIQLSGSDPILEKKDVKQEDYVQIANGDLLHNWPQLQGWISDDREFLLWRQRLNGIIAYWKTLKEDKGALLTSAPLDQAKKWRDSHINDLNEDERSYINDSIAEDERRTPEKRKAEKPKHKEKEPAGRFWGISYENENIKLAKKIIGGQDEDFEIMFGLAKKLKNERAFGYARRILERARGKPEANHPDTRLKLAQQLALVTYKDPDLLPDEKLDDAFNILCEADYPQTTKNQETLGLAGAIYKRRWEIDGQKQHLERSLAFYLRGYELGVESDVGYTGINAAFVLDLIAWQEEDESRQTNISLKSTADRRIEAREIRERIAKTLVGMAAKDEHMYLRRQWWFLATIAEAYFGLERYDEARKWLKEAAQLERVPEWERESTIRQLAQLARLTDGWTSAPGKERESEAWQALRESLKEIYFRGRDAKATEHMAEACCESAFTGRIGLALSGGGVRAALYHIGVLAKLAEMDLLRKVEALSCVSGGSIVGAHYYLEVRKLLSEKPDQEITKEDYIGIVKRVERDFLDGVQTNIRTSVLANPWTNLKMVFLSNYSRTQRVGELYEKKIFARVQDGEGDKPRWLNELIIRPMGESPDFQPKNDNWRRTAKVPMLILNATTLNTGHNWQFTTTWMGEPPSSIDSEVDGNYRLRRMYYEQAPGDHKRIRLGHAVAASSCVPGLFEPLALANLYEGLVVRLVDGGVYDNQGTASLLDQGCNVLLVSDASGQMNTMNDPGGGPLAVPLRTNSVLQARVRVAQYRELSARRRASALRRLMFIHLKKDLQVRPLDWIDCPDPADSGDSNLPLTKYGINKGAQERLAAIRTDLDSFSDAEAKSLMISGYRMTEFEIARNLPEFDKSGKAGADWQFLKFDESLTRAEAPASLLKLLSVAASLAFKIWRLWRPLGAFAIAIGVLLAGLFGWFCWKNWNASIISFDFGEADVSPWRLTWGEAAIAVATTAALSLLPAFARNILRVVDYRKTAYEIIVGVAMGLFGWIAAQLHLRVFDKIYLWWGSEKRLLGSQNRISKE